MPEHKTRLDFHVPLASILVTGRSESNVCIMVIMSQAPLSWRWVKDQQYCANPSSFYTCTPHGWAWRPDLSNREAHLNDKSKDASAFWEPEQGCALLRERGVRRMVMVGDSYMRHAYEGVTMMLSGDYVTGGLNEEGRANESCHGEGQFNEVFCRHLVSHNRTLCKGEVYLERRTHPSWMRLTQDMGEFDAIVWNGGEHHLGPSR